MTDKSVQVIEAAAVSSADRLTFTVFLALVAHALVIFGVTFSADLFSPPAPTLEITLATHKSSTEPDEAKYLAQHAQQASGISDTDQQLTTDQLANIDNAQIRQISPVPQVKKTQSQEKIETITTSGQSLIRIDREDTERKDTTEETAGNAATSTPLSLEIASLRARLAEQRQTIAKRPRIRRITSVATKSAVDAAYIGRWIESIELIGNKNFPEQAVDRGMVGKLRLAATLKPNGALHSVEILDSSGHQILDQAALKIVHLAAPFSPFPAEMRKDTDLLEIIRTWSFEITGLSTNSL